MGKSDAKQLLRVEISSRLAALPREIRAGYDAAICQQALELPELACAQSVMAYVPLPDEIDILPILRGILAQGKLLGLPRITAGARGMTVCRVSDLANDLQQGPYGLREPAADMPALGVDAIDACIVPGRAFSPQGSRLGRGAGYYDRFLAQTGAKRIALCYEQQIVEEIPVAAHDLPVHIIITPQRVMRI